ncbi:MAG: hypothetical protein JW958_07855 [Candidatus Eisenbacteria bacterium]|nr:hypothetical protein [Candidatus Eisenbacteria bacterium]
MIGFLRIAVPVLAIHLLETSLLHCAGSIFSRIDFLLLFLAFTAFPRGAAGGALIGAAIGVFRAFAWSGGSGVEPLAFLAAGAFAGWAYRKLVGESGPGLLLILFGTVLVHDLVALAGLLRFGFLPFFSRFVLETIPAGVLTAGVGALLRLGRSRLRRRVEAAA